MCDSKIITSIQFSMSNDYQIYKKHDQLIDDNINLTILGNFIVNNKLNSIIQRFTFDNITTTKQILIEINKVVNQINSPYYDLCQYIKHINYPFDSLFQPNHIYLEYFYPGSGTDHTILYPHDTIGSKILKCLVLGDDIPILFTKIGHEHQDKIPLYLNKDEILILEHNIRYNYSLYIPKETSDYIISDTKMKKKKKKRKPMLLMSIYYQYNQPHHHTCILCDDKKDYNDHLHGYKEKLSNMQKNALKKDKG